MAERASRTGSTTEGLPVAPSLGPELASAHIAPHAANVTRRTVYVCALAVLVALGAAGVAQALQRLIALVTNLAFRGTLSLDRLGPTTSHLGPWVILIPPIGGLVVGIMARYGSQAIRGHGIPEAMEQILTNESRIPVRMTFLKPLSSAVAIGTGGPFGAEGPIIATGGALGSVLGQVLTVTAAERKTLLAAGAAAGMAATFGSPVSAVLLAIELLLFEYRPRSLIPVSLAAATATGVRFAWAGSAPAFHSTSFIEPSGSALMLYVLLGGLVGVVSVVVTRAVYRIEDAFERLPIHWMWWPALGAIPVGIIGYFAPRTLGVGYDNIDAVLTGALATGPLLALCLLKFASWSIALGSGTSGGTLAPLFTIGGALGALIGTGMAAMLPAAGVDPRVAALVGMAAMFAGASRALLASVVFAFETTRQPLGLLPLLGGCSVAWLVSAALMKHSIMTERIARRGRVVPAEYAADWLAQWHAGEFSSRPVVTLGAGESVGEALLRLGNVSHQGFPVLDDRHRVVGVVMRRQLASAPHGRRVVELVDRPAITVHASDTLRHAADVMAHAGVGRLPVLSDGPDAALLGMLTRSDLVGAHRPRLRAERVAARALARG
ncbi:MAG TPA: chloride channel protein [Myxococcaceae bacterium]|nr:chloride channel protein [Myxococcaceae bacterium]